MGCIVQPEDPCTGFTKQEEPACAFTAQDEPVCGFIVEAEQDCPCETLVGTEPPPEVNPCDPVGTPTDIGSVQTLGDWARNSRVGPFWYAPADRIFAVMADNRAPTSRLKLAVLMSEDMGQTFALVDDVFPTMADNIRSFDAHRDGNVLYVATQEQTTGRVAYHEFSLATATWTVLNEEVLASFSTGTGGPTTTQTGVAITRRSTGHAAIFYQGDWEYREPFELGNFGTQAAGWFARAKLKVRSGAGVWSTAYDVGNPNDAVNATYVPFWLDAGHSYNGHVHVHVGRIVAGDAGRLHLFHSRSEPADVSNTDDLQIQTMRADNSLSACIEWRTTNAVGYASYFAYGDYCTYRDEDDALWIAMPLMLTYYSPEMTLWRDAGDLTGPDVVKELTNSSVSVEMDGQRSFFPAVGVRYLNGRLHTIHAGLVSALADKWFIYKSLAIDDWTLTPGLGGVEDRALQASPTYVYPAAMYQVAFDAACVSGEWIMRMAPASTSEGGFYFSAYRLDLHLPVDNSYTLSQWIADHS